MKITTAITSLFLLMTLFCSAQQTPTSKNTSVKHSETPNEVADSSFIILENTQEVYKGFYKDNKAFNGYFKVYEEDVFWVEYFKDGEKTTHYSKSLIKNQDEEDDYDDLDTSKDIMDIKSNFENGKIVDGEIIGSIKSGTITKKYRDGKIFEVLLEASAMHYYNILKIEITEKEIVFSHLRDNISTVRISPYNESLLMELIANNSVLVSTNSDYCDPKNPKPNSIISVYATNGRFKCVVYDKEADNPEYSDNISLLIKTFSLHTPITVTKDKSSSDILQEFIEEFLEEFLMDENENQGTPLTVAEIKTDKKGKIEEGIYWEGDVDGMGIYKIYKDGKTIKEGKNTLLDFQETWKEY